MAVLSPYFNALPAYRDNAAAPDRYSETKLTPALTLNPGFSLERGDYRVHLAGEKGLLRAKVNGLVASLYRSRGLSTASSFYTDSRATQVTIAASRGKDVFGTLTLRMDSEEGLLADSLYRAEIDQLRQSGAFLCEVTRLACNSEMSCPEVMATLFNVAFLLASDVHARTDLVAEVHPRHVRYYQRAMGYRIAGPERICLRVGAPAVLMHLSLEFAWKQICELAGTCHRLDRNLYRLFLPEAEQSGLLSKLTKPVSVCS